VTHPTRVGFIGLGLMGRLMSANLVKAGFDVRSFDLNSSGNCKSAKEAAERSDVLITMVPDGKAVRSAVLAALPGLSRGAIVVDMSSSDPATTRELGKLLKRKGIHMLDSPVSGARAKATDGTLALMVGGDAALLECVRPVLSAMGTEIFHCGSLGSGHATKALNNYLGAAGTVAGMEALLIGEKFGLDPKTLIAVINASTGKNSTTERKIPQQVFTKAFASGFALALMTKDVGIAEGLARSLRMETPYLKQTLKVWRAALSRLPAGADHTEIYRYLRKLNSPSRASASPRARSRRKPRRSS
jgi:3-hydroxyisobutyrate dehydrogenase